MLTVYNILPSTIFLKFWSYQKCLKYVPSQHNTAYAECIYSYNTSINKRLNAGKKGE